MSKTITSGGVAFMDLTDSRKLDAYITSNLPIAQIYNQNTKTYEPDWSKTNLQLSADIYLDAKAVTSDSYTSIVWYKKVGTQSKTQVGTGASLTINSNQLIGNVSIITYICEATYNYNNNDTNPPTAHAEITFTRVDTGLDGSNGVDGTGVTILGSYDTLAQLQAAHPSGNAGDSYIVNGDLYVWSIDASKWENVGNIQGPAGANGRDAKSIILNGDSQVFKISKTNAITPSTIKITAQTFNTSVTNWSYSINGGQTFLSTAPTGVSINGNIVTITGATITSNSIVIKASDGEVEDVFTVYKAFDGADGSKGDNGTPAPIVFLTNENITFSANAQGQIPLTTITSNIVAYSGTTKVTPTIGTITGMPTGMTITPSTITASNEIMLTISIANNSTLGSNANNMGVINIPITSPISTILSLTWSKVNTGTPGVSASLVDIVPSAYYFKSNMGKDGTFTPEFIYLYPRFQNATYNGWQYSIDGGITWVAVTNANGLSVGTYNSIINTLRISRTSTLYTDTVTSISFRCNSLTNGIYDTISIAKIYDVIDLQIGGRNLLLNSGTSVTNSLYNIKNYYLSIPPIQGEQYTLTLKGTLGEGKTSFSAYNSGGTVSFGALKRLGTSDLYSHTFTWTNGGRTGLDTAIYIYTMTNAIVAESTIEWIKLEKGNKVTMDWTPAPEDINANIEKVDTRLTNSLAEIKTTTDSISSKVSSTEETVKSINNNITSLTTKISNAEQKITPTAIVSTVRQSTDYINDLGKKVGTNEIISKINQTAETVTISANKIGLLGATNIPDLTADKIKGGTLTLGGSSATTQNGQLLVKNASNVDVLKVNKDGIIVKSGHLAVARDFTNQMYDWNTNTWINSTNTSQLDLGDNFIRMGAYGASGYANSMTLLDDGLYFQGSAHAIGNWDSFVGHDDLGDFVIQETVRNNIYFRGTGDIEMARISGDGLHVNGPISGGIASDRSKQFTNVFVKHFPSQHSGYIAIRLGMITRSAESMITIKGHITSYFDSSSFEASCYFYKDHTSFYGTVATMSNPDVLKEVYFAEGVSDGCVYLILGGSNSYWYNPTVAISNLTIGWAGNTSTAWNTGWTASVHANLSNFKTVTSCARSGMKKTLWSGAVQIGATVTLDENLRNFKFLTCLMGDASAPWGIPLGTFLDDEVTELHFGAIFTGADSIAGGNLYGARFNINSQTSLSLQSMGTRNGAGAYLRKIVGWR